MLQFPAFMRQYPWSSEIIPTSFLLPAQWPKLHGDELLLAMEESDYEEKISEIGKFNSNLTVIGKGYSVDNDKEDVDNEADDDDDDVNNGEEESEADDFDQETG
ncbi:unnamed protein product [Cuscuta campestris]|uniref:Anaphase-promoting complex subunit 15 n=1 Tax=Cuscuta campestris TaxID=132261 RepID=A0A484LTQ6_9ASTE|nr:unnamed protein product [Cuscuta campestris]